MIIEIAAEDHGIGYDDATKAFILEHAGQPQPLELTWSGGETMVIADDWEVEVLHVPGHSHGHLSLYDRRHRTLYTGDAIHWSYYPSADDGTPKLPPTYLYGGPYLSTIRMLGLLDAAMQAGAHWPLQRGEEVASFLVESRRFVELVEQTILMELEQAPQPLTPRELIEQVGPQ